jgi:hypothetical protein
VFYEPRVLAMIGSPTQRQFVEKIIPYLYVNPAYNLLTLYRDIFKFGRETHFGINEGGGIVVEKIGYDQPISYDCLLIFAVQAVITFVLGYAFFLRSKGRFADEV